ncbi:unnamed protein product, partial [Prorocentrum cordatum]
EGAKIHLFTDGSKNPKKPSDDAWFVVIVGDDNLGFSFQGAIVGKHKSGTDIALKDDIEHETTSTTIEITALIWAFAWVRRYNPHHITTIYTDSLGALQLAKRLAFTDRDPKLVRTLCILYDMVSHKIDLQHVHAHDYNPWNEVADAAANHGRLREVTAPQPEWASVMDGASHRDWEFLVDTDPNTREAYPAFVNGSLIANRVETTAEPRHLHNPTESSDKKIQVEINIAIFNIQSGGKDALGSGATQHTTTTPDAPTPTATTSSPAAKGFNYGCELHALLSKPHGKSGKRELYFKPDQFTVIVKDPRLLIVRVAAPGFNQVLAVAHAPHSKALATEKDLNWKKLTEATEKHQVSIIFFDASARTGNITSTAIGDKGFKQNEDPNGHRLHELLLTNHLAAANTFVSHGPEHYTWHSGKDPHRIDYFVTPKGYDSIEECTVLHGIDSGQDPETKDDRYPVKLQLAYQIASPVARGAPKLDESKLHLAIVTEKITEAAHECFRPHGRTPHKPYITKRSFALLRVRRSLLKTTRIARKNGIASHFGDKRLHYTAKLIAKEALLPDPADVSALADLSDYDKLMVASLILSTPSLATSKPILQKWITRDRDDFLERTADEMGTAIDDRAPRVEALYAKRLLTFGGRKPKKPPTPIIRTNDDGKPFTTKSEIADHALAFYGKVEQATATDADGVAADYNKRARHEGPEPKIQNAMPKHQLTSQLAAAKRGRRGGPDQLTDDMSRASPEGMARLLHPVLIKTHFESTEPIAAKGGYPTYFHNGQGAMELQKSNRGILLNNTIGKMHSCFLRSRVKGEAFHSVIRELRMQLPTSADELNDLIERIDIPDFIRPALKERLHQQAYNNQNIDDEHLCHMLADHHTINWMTAKSARHDQLPRTSTRPGVPYSDVAFNIHFAIMMRAIDQAAREEEAHGQQIGGHEIEACSDPIVSPTPHEGSVLRNMSFVDDLTDYNSTANASDLINTTTLAAARLCTAAFQHGLKPHPDKTKAIPMHYGAGATKEKQRIAKEGITYLELDGLSIKVQLVMQQKALGTIIAAGGVTGPEICPRVNRALGAARPLEKQILRRKKLSKEAKVKYVNFFSTSSLTCNHHVWSDLTMKDLKHISAKHMGPYRVAASPPKTNSPDQHISEAEAYIHHIRDQAQGAKLQKDIQMIPVADPTEGFDLRDDTNNQKYVCYACGRVATRQGMAIHMGRDHPDHEDPRFWATGTACRCCQTEHHSLPRLIKHLSVAHRCRKSWHAWHLQTMEPLTEQQIAKNFTAIAEATNANKKQGRHPTFSDKPAHPCDVTPLPLLETSPVVPKVFARLESSPSSPPASSPAGPAERQEVVFITDRPRQAADLQQIMANSGVTSVSGLDYTQIAIHGDGRTSEQMPELRRVQRRILHGETAAISVEFPRRTWYLHDVSDVLGSRASRQRTTEAPWGMPQVSETIADEIFAANNVTREILRMLFAATTTNVPYVAAIPAESTCRQTPEYQHVANQTTAYETSTNHYDLGATQILDNGTRDDLRNGMTTANAEEIDFAIADLIDGNIVARWGLRTATVAPTSQNLNTNDAYYIE